MYPNLLKDNACIIFGKGVDNFEIKHSKNKLIFG